MNTMRDADLGPEGPGYETPRVLIVLAQVEQGDALFQASTLASALSSTGAVVTITSCFGAVPVSDRVTHALDGCGAALDVAPHLLGFDDTVSYLAAHCAFHDVVISFQDVADIYPALDSLHWRPPLIEVGAAETEALAGPKHHTRLYVALDAPTARAAASRRDAKGFACWHLPLPARPDSGGLSGLIASVIGPKDPVTEGCAESWAAAVRFARSSVTPAPAPRVFRTFWQGGFECSTQRRRDGHRVDVQAANGHDAAAEADFTQLAGLGFRTCRSGLRWHKIEPQPGAFDFADFRAAVRAAQKTGTQVIWDVLHYGYPDDIDPWQPAFVDRFARFARRAAQTLRDMTDEVPFWCPVNEISFFSWGGGDVGYLNPFGHGRGLELKVQLARAAIAASHALREVDPRARLVACEPLISIRADSGHPHALHAAHRHHQAQFEACDFLMGRAWPQLGGSPDLVDVVGLNFYPPNQWILGQGPLHSSHPFYRPLGDLLTQAYARYGKPVFLAETGDEADARASWFSAVAKEVMRARSRGVPVEGVCLYPVADHIGWDDERICPNGLLGHIPMPGGRRVHAPLAQALSRAQLALNRAQSDARAVRGPDLASEDRFSLSQT